LLLQQLRAIVDRGIALTLVSSPGPELDDVAREVGAEAIAIAMAREPAPVSDLGSLRAVAALLRRRRFDVVHSSTPKAGLLAAVAGRISGTAIRIHTFTGQPWIELSGLRRRIPRECDRLIGRLSTQCFADSRSQAEFLISEGLVRREKIDVIGAGSISGVDLSRFSRARWGGATAAATRRALEIPDDALVVMFVGRLTRDKGISELVAAFEQLSRTHPRIHLVLVGPFEPDRDPLPVHTLDLLKRHSRIRTVGFTRTPEQYLATAMSSASRATGRGLAAW